MKTTSAAFLVVLSLSIASCKPKTYTCTCEYAEGISGFDNLGELTRKEAKDRCAKIEEGYKKQYSSARCTAK